MDVTKKTGPPRLTKVVGPERLGSGIGPAWVSYENSSPDRALAYHRDEGSVVTRTQALPFKLEAIVDLDAYQLSKVTMIVDHFGEEADDSLRLGVRSVQVELEETRDDESLCAENYHRVPVHRLLLIAIMSWSHNSDGSPVTIDEARALTRRGARRSKSFEERWKQVAEVYLEAKGKGEPTTVAVARAFGLGSGRKGQDAARSLVRRARQAGHLPPAGKKN